MIRQLRAYLILPALLAAPALLASSSCEFAAINARPKENTISTYAMLQHAQRGYCRMLSIDQ